MDGDVMGFAQVMMVIVASTSALAAIGLVTRALWNKTSGAMPPRAVPHNEDRQQRLETAVDAIAIEVERISEAQRFMVGLLSEPLSARRVERAELPSGERSGRVNTPH